MKIKNVADELEVGHAVARAEASELQMAVAELYDMEESPENAVAARRAGRAWRALTGSLEFFLILS